MILPTKVLHVSIHVVGFDPCVSVGCHQDFADERRSLSGHLPVGMGVIVVEKQLDVLGRDFLSGLVVDEAERNIIGVNI